MSDDRDIIRSVLGGSNDAFALIVDKYKDKVFKIVSYNVPDENVDEVANDVFFKAFRSLSSYRSDAPFGNWISVIAVRACKDFWRSEYSRKERPFGKIENFETAIEFLESVESDAPTPEDKIIGKELSEFLKAAVNKLSEKERVIINMIYADGRSVGDVASHTRLTDNNVKVIAHRARKKLADIINGMLGENL